uniref:Trace amine associated receptor 1 n=1 Tax=Xiphophorus maculatus TaxID=8083 RepID=A0A3B5QXQ2_XIPMA
YLQRRNLCQCEVLIQGTLSKMSSFRCLAKRTSSTICTLLYIFLGLLSAITVCGNLLVIISIIYFKQLHTPSNYLIVSLAVTDLLVGIAVFPLSMSFSLSYCLYYRDLFCKIRDSVDVILSSTSISNLCCISVDRYYAVCQPLTYKSKINTGIVLVMILMSWGISILVAIGFIIVEINQGKCQENCFSDCATYLRCHQVCTAGPFRINSPCVSGPVITSFMVKILQNWTTTDVFLLLNRIFTTRPYCCQPVAFPGSRLFTGSTSSQINVENYFNPW